MYHMSCVFDGGIEGYPVIIRFKTWNDWSTFWFDICSIEGYPVIIRFKTSHMSLFWFFNCSIEGYPVIIRFKTWMSFYSSPFNM